MRTYSSIEEEKKDKEYREAFITLVELRNKINKPAKNGKMYNAKQLRYIADNWYKKSVLEIAKHLKIQVSTAFSIAKKLRLTRIYLKENEITFCELYRHLTGRFNDTYSFYLLEKYKFPYKIKNNTKIVDLNDFFIWFKKHIKLIRADCYNEGIFPIEPNWFIEKVRADKRAVEYIFKRPWTFKDDELLKKMVKDNKSYRECSFVLKRTGVAIKRRCFDLKIKKPKRTPPVLWTDEQKTKLKELWLKGYEPCIIAEEIKRSDREIIAYLERFKYFGLRPQKFVNSPKMKTVHRQNDKCTA
jgi:hypothetical protein